MNKLEVKVSFKQHKFIFKELAALSRIIMLKHVNKALEHTEKS
jgi:hypothetical protein